MFNINTHVTRQTYGEAATSKHTIHESIQTGPLPNCTPNHPVEQCSFPGVEACNAHQSGNLSTACSKAHISLDEDTKGKVRAPHNAHRTAHTTSALCMLLFHIFPGISGWQGRGGLRGKHTTAEAPTLPPHQCNGGCSRPHLHMNKAWVLSVGTPLPFFGDKP